LFLGIVDESIPNLYSLAWLGHQLDILSVKNNFQPPAVGSQERSVCPNLVFVIGDIAPASPIVRSQSMISRSFKEASEKGICYSTMPRNDWEKCHGGTCPGWNGRSGSGMIVFSIRIECRLKWCHWIWNVMCNLSART
jgi:hypothetical protein